MDNQKSADVESHANGEQQTESLLGAHVGERSAQAQPPEAGVACNDDVRVSINGQLPGAAAVACSVWFAKSLHNSKRVI